MLERLRMIAQVVPILDLATLKADKLTVKQLDTQLDWHREFVDTGPKDQKHIPMKKDVPVKALKLAALLQAVERYVAAPPAATPSALVDLAMAKIEVEEADE